MGEIEEDLWDFIDIGGPISPRVRSLLGRYGFERDEDGRWSRPAGIEGEIDIILDAHEEDSRR